MRWLRRRQRNERSTALIAQAVDPEPEAVVDLDRDTVPLGREGDATSLLLTLTMEFGPTFLRWDGESQRHMVTVKDGLWSGRTQLEALNNAYNALKNSTPS